MFVGLCGTENRAVERKGGGRCMIIGVSQVGSWLAGLASAVQMPSGGHSLDASISNLFDANWGDSVLSDYWYAHGGARI